MDDQKIRVSKMLTEQNICSRTKAEKWIEQGYIKSNGKVIEKPEHKINKYDFVLIDKKAISDLEEQKTIVLNKPKNFVSSFQDPKYKHALTLVTENSYAGNRYSAFDRNTMGVVGRLDADSRGLLIYSQDGSFAKKIIGPESDVEKEYLVKVKGVINEKKISLLKFGLSLDGKPLKKATVEQIDKQLLKFILTEGKNRQIRRMCGAVDLEVTDLFRTRIDKINLPSKLKEGQWLFLDEV